MVRWMRHSARLLGRHLMHRLLASVSAVLLAALCGSAAPADAQPVPTAYTVTDLATYGDYADRATVGAMVNDAGEVLVYSPERLPAPQFLWSAGTFTDLSSLQAVGGLQVGRVSGTR